LKKKNLKEIQSRIAALYKVSSEQVKHIKKVKDNFEYKIFTHSTDPTPNVYWTTFSLFSEGNYEPLTKLTRQDFENNQIIRYMIDSVPIAELFLERPNHIYLQKDFLCVPQLENLFGVLENSLDREFQISFGATGFEECPICMNVKCVVQIRCGEQSTVFHSVCAECTEKQLLKGRYVCPLCRFEHEGSFIRNLLQHESARAKKIPDAIKRRLSSSKS